MVGVGTVAMRKERAVKLQTQWCPDDRHLILWKRDTRTSENLTFAFIAIDVDEPEHEVELDRSVVYRVDALGEHSPVRLGRGAEPVLSHDGRFVAFHERPTTSFLGFWRRSTGESVLHLAECATGKRWTLDRHVTYYHFSPDGRRLMWESTEPAAWFAADVQHPEQKTRLADSPVSADAAARPAALSNADGSIHLALRKRTIEVPHFGSWNPLQWLAVGLYWLGMPEMIFYSENLEAKLPDGKTRRLTHFIPPW